jgi:hypothetical protein
MLLTGGYLKPSYLKPKSDSQPDWGNSTTISKLPPLGKTGDGLPNR